MTNGRARELRKGDILIVVPENKREWDPEQLASWAGALGAFDSLTDQTDPYLHAESPEDEVGIYCVGLNMLSPWGTREFLLPPRDLQFLCHSSAL